MAAIRGGEVPCLENAVLALAKTENAKAVDQAQLLYGQRMQSVRFPTETLEELSDIHAASEREALATFMKCSFRDDEQEYQKKLMVCDDVSSIISRTSVSINCCNVFMRYYSL